MSRTNRIATAAVGVITSAALAVGISGCATGEADAGPTSGEGIQASKQRESPAETPKSTSPADEAVTLAEAAVREYYRVSSAAWRDPDTADIESFKDVAISAALGDMRNNRVRYISNGWHQEGDFEVEVVEVRDVELASEPKADPPIVPTVQLMICIDASDAHVVDQNGDSVEPPNAPTRRYFRFAVQNHDYPDGKWLVANGEWQEGETC